MSAGYAEVDLKTTTAKDTAAPGSIAVPAVHVLLDIPPEEISTWYSCN